MFIKYSTIVISAFLALCSMTVSGCSESSGGSGFIPNYNADFSPEDPTWFADREESSRPGQIAYLGSDVANVEPAWIRTTGEIPESFASIAGLGTQVHAVRVFVIDGFISRHPDVIGNVNLNLSTDVYNEDDSPVPTDEELHRPWPLFDHGTAVTSVVAALGNSRGIVGVAPGVEIVHVQAFDIDGWTRDETLARALDYCTANLLANGPNVIVMSWGTFFPAVKMRKSITRAAEAGVILVAAAGNTFSTSVTYPASDANVIAVGAVNVIREDDRVTVDPAEFSTFGADVDIWAPGQNVWTAQGAQLVDYRLVFNEETGYYEVETEIRTGEFYEKLNGTSFAAPIVAGTIALALSRNPGLNREDLVRLLQETAEPLFTETNGVVNIGRFVERAMNMPLAQPPQTRPLPMPESETTELAATAAGNPRAEDESPTNRRELNVLETCPSAPHAP